MASVLRVESIMTPSIITIEDSVPVTESAKLMIKHEVGSVVVTNNGRPIGILTKSDIVHRVIARALDPGLVLNREILSQPLITVTLDFPLEDVMVRMSKNGIKRLVVVQGEEPVGVISVSDILQSVPNLFAIMREEAPEIQTHRAILFFSGYCDDCKDYSAHLRDLGGFAVCPNCVNPSSDEIEEEERII